MVSALLMAGAAQAASCSSTGGNFAAWKKEFAAEAKANGIKAKGLAALASSSYSTGTIKADRNQKSFKLSLEQFMAKRGAAAIISRGKKLKAANAALFAKLEKSYRRAGRAADRHLGHGDGLWRGDRQPADDLGGGDAGL